MGKIGWHQQTTMSSFWWDNWGQISLHQWPTWSSAAGLRKTLVSYLIIWSEGDDWSAGEFISKSKSNRGQAHRRGTETQYCQHDETCLLKTKTSLVNIYCGNKMLVINNRLMLKWHLEMASSVWHLDHPVLGSALRNLFVFFQERETLQLAYTCHTKQVLHDGPIACLHFSLNEPATNVVLLNQPRNIFLHYLVVHIYSNSKLVTRQSSRESFFKN